MRKFFVLAATAASFALGGCLATLDNGPKRLYSDEKQVGSLRATAPPWDFSVIPTKETRNNYITARMYAVDLNYTAYFTSLTKERQLGTLGSDLAVIGLGAATSVIGGAETKAALGAATTAIAGAKTAVDKDVLLSQTVQILQNQMEVSRAEIKLRINQRLLEPDVSKYTMAQAMSDLEDYYRAGTLAGALEALSSTVGSDAQQLRDVNDAGSPAGKLRTPAGNADRI